MSERQNRKIYQIPWRSFVMFLLGTALCFNSNCQNIPKFLFSLSLLLQWWFIQLSTDKPRRFIVSFIRRACTSKAQAAELRRVHPVRPPPEPNSTSTSKRDPRLLRKEAKQVAKQLSQDIADCSLRGKVVLFPLLGGWLLHYLLRSYEVLWPVWFVGMILAAAFWIQHAFELASQGMDNVSYQTNRRPTLAFIKNVSSKKQHCAVIYTVPDGLLFEYACSWWILSLCTASLGLVCSYIGGLEASLEFVVC
jgi:hypothetical protein